MKSFVGKRPPGWLKRPEQPVIVVAGDEEKAVRENLYAFSDFWRQKVRRRADQILNRNPFASRVDICSAKGEVIRTVKRDSTAARETVSEETQSDNALNAVAKEIAPPKLPKEAAVRTKSKRRGRPPGKRSDPDFTQITAYVRTKTIEDVKIKLIRQGSMQDTSELIEELLSAWLRR